MILIFIIVGFSKLTYAEDQICEIEKGKFTKPCKKQIEQLSCDFELSKSPMYFEQNLGVCQCMLTSGEFFKQHKSLQEQKNILEQGTPEYMAISEKIEQLCENGKPIEVSSNGVTYRGIFRYDPQMDACINTFVDRSNGIVGDRDRFAYPGAYNWSLKTYEYELGDQYGKVKIDEELIDLNISRGNGTNCAGTYEQILDRRENEARRRSFAEKERTEKIIFTVEKPEESSSEASSESTPEN